MNGLFDRFLGMPKQIHSTSSPYPKEVPGAINILLLSDGEGIQSKVLFDSRNIRIYREGKTVRKFTPPLSGGFSHIVRGKFKFQVTPTLDKREILNMVFGSVEMSYKGHHSKLHIIPRSKNLASTKILHQDSDRLFFSKIFSPLPLIYKTRGSEAVTGTTNERGETFHSSYQTELKSGEHFYDAISQDRIRSGSSQTTHNRDSGLGRSVADMSRPDSEPSGIFRRSGYASLRQMRLLSDVKTSLSSGDLRRSVKTFPRGGYDSNISLGLVVIFDCVKQCGNENYQRPAGWWMDRLDILEFFFYKLKKSFSLAYRGRGKFYDIAFDAFVDFQLEMRRMMKSSDQAESNYVWLQLHNNADQDFIMEKLFYPLKRLMETGDRKDTNFFLSRLLTAVFTYHLGWVATVAPSEVEQRKNSVNQQNLRNDGCNLSYNPIWGQLCELYGAIGCPARMARTIIVGTKPLVMERFRLLLSFAIRCTQVYNRSYNISRDCNPAEAQELWTPARDPKKVAVGSTVLKSKKQTPSSKSNSPGVHYKKEMQSVKSSSPEVPFVTEMPAVKSTSPEVHSIKTVQSQSPPESLQIKVHENKWMLDDYDEIIIKQPDMIMNIHNVPNLSVTDISQEYLESKLKETVLSSSDEEIAVDKISSPTELLMGENIQILCHSGDDPIVEDTKGLTNIMPLLSLTDTATTSTTSTPIHTPISELSETSEELSVTCASPCLVPKDLPNSPDVATENGSRLPEEKPEIIISREDEYSTVEETVELPSLQTPFKKNEVFSKSAEYDASYRAKLIEMPELSHSDYIENPRVAEGLFGEYSSLYSSLFILHATPDLDGIKHKLRDDLKCAVNMSLGGRLVEEAVGIVANTDTFEIDVVSSSKKPPCDRSYDVCMSPLVSCMVETLMECNSYNSPELLLNCFEYHLRKIYLQSHVLADFLLASTRKRGAEKLSFSIDQLALQSNISTYDIPLLFSIATTHSPEIGDMFGYCSM